MNRREFVKKSVGVGVLATIPITTSLANNPTTVLPNIPYVEDLVKLGVTLKSSDHILCVGIYMDEWINQLSKMVNKISVLDDIVSNINKIPVRSRIYTNFATLPNDTFDVVLYNPKLILGPPFFDGEDGANRCNPFLQEQLSGIMNSLKYGGSLILNYYDDLDIYAEYKAPRYWNVYSDGTPTDWDEKEKNDNHGKQLQRMVAKTDGCFQNSILIKEERNNMKTVMMHISKGRSMA